MTGDATPSGDEPRPAPFADAYWIDGVAVAAGEYPGALRAEHALAKVRALLDAGVRRYVDLTDAGELDPYLPLLEREAAARGVTVVHRRLTIPDMGIPTRRRMAEILDALDDAVAAGEPAYVHCWGGVGRTGTVVACWLVRRGHTSDEALAEVKRLFATTSPAKQRRHPEGSPQTAAQRAFVRAWKEERLSAVSSRLSAPAARDIPRPQADSRELTAESRRSRIRGALVGLATGDAVGTTVEFMPPGTFPPVTDMTGGGPFALKPGQWTDDTSLALCLAESLVERGGFDAADQMTRYLRWRREGHLSSTGYCFDIGNTTAHALSRFERTGEPYSGPTARDSAGNGSLMRLAPVPMWFASRPAEALAACAASSRTTHGARVAVDACRYLGALLLGAFAGATKEVLLAPRYEPVAGCWTSEPLCPEIDAIAAGSFRAKQPPAIRGSGYAAHSLEAALWAFHSSDNYKEGCLLAVNLGDDADTTAAVYGQIAGAFYGERAIPAEWRSKLALWPVIDGYAERLCEAGSVDA